MQGQLCHSSKNLKPGGLKPGEIGAYISFHDLKVVALFLTLLPEHEGSGNALDALDIIATGFGSRIGIFCSCGNWIFRSGGIPATIPVPD
jgi:hypothetical protein